MGRVTVVEFTTLDGVIEDPDGRGRTATGGWAFRYGPETVAGDKFRLASALEDGALLFGRRTWEHFATLWPGRDDSFADIMNRIPKLVVSRTLDDVSGWSNSTLLHGDVADFDTDVILVGSATLAHALVARDLVDEFRLLVFPLVLGAGRRLFEHAALDLRLVSAEPVGAALLLTYERERSSS